MAAEVLPTFIESFFCGQPRTAQRARHTNQEGLNETWGLSGLCGVSCAPIFFKKIRVLRLCSHAQEFLYSGITPKTPLNFSLWRLRTPKLSVVHPMHSGGPVAGKLRLLVAVAGSLQIVAREPHQSGAIEKA
jgi:hypothetical protein